MLRGGDGAGPGRCARPPPRPPTAGQADLQRPGVPDGLHERPRATEVGHQPEGRLAHREPGVVGDDSDVAGQRELEAGAHGVPLDRGDRHEVRSRPQVNASWKVSIAASSAAVERGELGQAGLAGMPPA